MNYPDQIRKPGLQLTGHESTRLLTALKSTLNKAFINGDISHYLISDANAPMTQIMACQGTNSPDFPGLKLAYQIWSAMSAADRHNVLQHFQHLLTVYEDAVSCTKSTLSFCAVFIHLLSDVLAATQEYPD